MRSQGPGPRWAAKIIGNVTCRATQPALFRWRIHRNWHSICGLYHSPAAHSGRREGGVLGCNVHSILLTQWLFGGYKVRWMQGSPSCWMHSTSFWDEFVLEMCEIRRTPLRNLVPRSRSELCSSSSIPRWILQVYTGGNRSQSLC